MSGEGKCWISNCHENKSDGKQFCHKHNLMRNKMANPEQSEQDALEGEGLAQQQTEDEAEYYAEQAYGAEQEYLSSGGPHD